MPTQPTTNNLEGSWKEELSRIFGWEIIFGANSNAKIKIEQFISDLRKHDEEMLIKMLPKSHWQYLKSEIEELFKEYYEK